MKEWKDVPEERFPNGDPLRDLHVSRRERLAEDGGPTSDAITSEGADDEFDRDEVKARGGIVPPEALQ